MVKSKLAYSCARCLYLLDTFLSTMKGQAIMLVCFGFTMTVVCGLFVSLIPVTEGSHSIQETAALEESAGSAAATEAAATAHVTQHGIGQAIWTCWLFISDPGAQGEEHEWKFRIPGFVISVHGMVFFFVILGFVVDSIREKMDDLKRGRSNVIEKNHSLLLGWTDKSISLIKQLCLANESEGGSVIVILAEAEKEFIEGEIEAQIEPEELRKTKVVVRTGSPLIISDLKKVSAQMARSITILATSIDADKSDAACLRVILSLRGLFKLQGHVVAEIRDVDNEPLVHLVGGNIVETLVSHDIIGRLILLAARSPGLSKVYNSLLGFEGDEFYCKAWPSAVGASFGSLAERFPLATPIGVKTASGKIVIKPKMDYVIADKDEIVVLADDNDSYTCTAPVSVLPSTKHTIPAQTFAKEKILICGWRRDIQDMLVLLDDFLVKGSEVHLLSEITLEDREVFFAESGIEVDTFENCVLKHHVGNTAVRRYLDPLPLEEYTSIMVLCDSQRELDILNSDSHSLATVLLIRDLQKNRKDQRKENLFGPRIVKAIDNWARGVSNKCPCITEILDPRTQKTVGTNVSITQHSDFVMSNELVSCMLAMISESREVKQILHRLLSPKSNTFAVLSSRRYIQPKEVMSYLQLAQRLRTANELLVGYLPKHPKDKDDTVVLNPKDKAIVLPWAEYDLVIVSGPVLDNEHALQVKSSVVDRFENHTRRHNLREAKVAPGAPPPPTGVRAGNPPEPRIRSQRSFISKAMENLPVPPTFDGDIEITPEVRRQLRLLQEEVDMLLEQYTKLQNKQRHDPLSVTPRTAGKYAPGSAKVAITDATDAKGSEVVAPPKSKKSYTTSALVAYKVDTFISTRKGQTITLVSFGTVFTISIGLLISVIEHDMTIPEALWETWMYMTFPGAQREAEHWDKRGIAMVVSIVGILFFAVILGFVVDSVREKMDSLKKGKSQVVEENHTLLLGWTDKSIYLIRELCRANESEKGGVVVVLAEADKEELEAELHSQMHESDLLGTKVVFRSGNPLLIVDLLKVSAHTARSIVIMATVGDADKSDASVLRIILSLLGLPSLKGHIVAEVRDIDNEPLISLVGGGAVESLVSHDVIGRLVIMSARSPGLAKVFSAVLGFEGNEFYINEWPTLVGVRFDQLQGYFPDAIPIGIETVDGAVIIKPEMTRPMGGGEKIIFLAEDNDSYKALEAPMVVPVCPDHPLVVTERQVEKILMCGWRRDIRDMIKLIDDVALRGSEVHLLCEDPPIEERDTQLVEAGLDLASLSNIALIHQYGNTAIRRHVDQLPLEMYTSVMILGDQSRETDILHSDSHSLSTVLLLRGLQAARRRKAKQRLFTQQVADSIAKWVHKGEGPTHQSCPCITEILDPRTQKTIASNKTISSHSEFIQSNELVSCMLAMISESRKVKKILNELLGTEGCTFTVEPSTRYCSKDEQLSFYQVAQRARKSDEVLCGYQLRGAADETVLNPPEKGTVRSWKDLDLVIIRDKRRKEDDKKLHLLQESTTAFEDMARHHRVQGLLEQHDQDAVRDTVTASIGNARTDDEHVVDITRDVLQRLSGKLSVLLKECEQHRRQHGSVSLAP
ncbi:ion channel [Achlya hypogyna]|uniref:Ion channel n=1 Tax=Achlya hypogyna TaxID=1202772 RepID=A0A1V9YBT2_ACHHY|nr:ion channel [Achlya hypogyna]